MKVNWDDDIPNISGKIKHVLNHQPVEYSLWDSSQYTFPIFVPRNPSNSHLISHDFEPVVYSCLMFGDKSPTSRAPEALHLQVTAASPGSAVPTLRKWCHFKWSQAVPEFSHGLKQSTAGIWPNPSRRPVGFYPFIAMEHHFFMSESTNFDKMLRFWY